MEEERCVLTIGYGVTNWPDFAARLKDGRITRIVDVRREGSMSRNGNFFYQRHGIEFALRSVGIAHLAEPALSKGKKEGLKAYHSRLYHALSTGHGPEGPAYGRIMNEIVDSWRDNGRIALLCACRDPYRCHRKILANFLHEELEVPIVHL